MTNKSYADLKTELDEVMVKLQDSELDIDEATKLYERGVKLVAELEKYLKQAEVKIEKVKAKVQKG